MVGCSGRLVVPRCWGGTRHWWSQDVKLQSEGVVDRFVYHRDDYRCEPVCAEVDVDKRRQELAVVFLDYGRASTREAKRGTPAEVVFQEWVKSGRPGERVQYLQENGNWVEGLPL